MKYLVIAVLVITGVIHLLPLAGVLGNEQLAALYGITLNEPNLSILMRHRAILFGLIGGFILFSAVKPALRTSALIGGMISVVSFLYLATAAGSYNAQIEWVFFVDLAILPCLVLGAIGHVLMLRTHTGLGCVGGDRSMGK